MSEQYNWDDIRFFLALARGGSLAEAARKLSVEHATVSRRANRLEEALGLKLFDRLAKGWSLTDDGRNLLKYAETVESESLSLQRIASGIDSLHGKVRLSAPPVVLGKLIAPNLLTLQTKYPDLDIELVGERKNANIIHAEADIAVRLGPKPTAPDLVTRRVGMVQYNLYGVKEFLTRKPEDQVFIGFDNSLPHLPHKQWIEEEAAERRTWLYTNDLETMLNATLAGSGIALLPDFLAKSHANLSLLSSSPATWEAPLFLILHPDVRKSPRVRVVVDYLMETLKPHLS